MNGKHRISKGNIQIAGQHFLLIQQVQIQCGNCHLQKCLLQRGQTQIPLILKLKEVIQKTDKAEAKSQSDDEKDGVILHGGDIAHQTKDRSYNEHQAAHHRCTGFVVVPGRAYFPNGLSCLQCPQDRQ